MNLDQIKGVLVEAAGRFSRNGVVDRAAALSFYTVFSLAPILLVTLAVVGAIVGRERTEQQLLTEFESLMGKQGSEFMASLLANAAKPGEGRGVLAAVVGVVAMVIGATGAFAQLKEALNAVWGVAAAPIKLRWYQTVWKLVRTRLLSFAMVLVVGFLLLISLVVSAGLAAAGSWASERLAMTGVLMHLANFVASLGIITVLLAMIFKFLPDARIRWSEVWLGAAITAILFNVGKYAIGAYLGRSAVTSAFGAAGSLVVVLLWIYYSAIIILIGAEMTVVTAKRRGRAIEARHGFEVRDY